MGSSRGSIFWLQIVYLLILSLAAIAYGIWPKPPLIPDFFGPIPIGVPWFGALGAILISLTGVFQHARAGTLLTNNGIGPDPLWER
jgi:hypothetical protein